jgi:GABA(A) receptor-associated protein
MDFKYNFTFIERYNEATNIRKKYPGRIPIICEKNKKCKQTPNLDKKKYLVPCDLTLGQFLHVIRRRMSITNPSLALFLMINGKIYSSAEMFSNIYESEKDQDGFLYILYTTENTFG